MTIKTWKERAKADPWGSTLVWMQAEIDELRAENLKQDEEYVVQGLRLIQLEKRLDAWERQPIAFYYDPGEELFYRESKFYPEDHSEVVELIAKPKEQS